ncbi:DUF1365 domain-containing protein [Pseudoalteromonas sp. MMG005]|uniref:DUF1365 domain-containing protein n=1 Tax=Pseudoalteromonas sp. MMG005 TaxID=2822682 RepID=UPI001B39F11B|nr:DUF1365 domain-containing protein [Pseudoalteromonas sp. MMG005]MBQ4846823.1 DUF1365 domain-containing protein [Pseudoalteromonas sp. MMG005]
MGLNSALYLGDVSHRRLEPTEHKFKYPMYMAWIDLDELDHLNAVHPWFGTNYFKPLRFKQNDYLKGYSGQLKDRALTVSAQLGAQPSSDSVMMLCQLRCFGLYFSPVNFYFFADPTGKFTHMVAEVSNTPWNECHCYLVYLDRKVNFKKVFHVSPFMNLDMHYHWSVRAPAASTLIHIENRREQTRLFDATLRLKRYTLSRENITFILKRFPAMTVSIFKGIYWQALRLFLKKVPFIGHPGS